MTTIILDAASFAWKKHLHQERKASLIPNIPYYSHLLSVAGIIMEHGGNADEVAAGFLHDVLEDTECTREELQAAFPASVVDLVLECTEAGSEGAVKAPWRQRKNAYLDHLSQASAGALLISSADKLHSLRGLKQTVQVQGLGAYENLVKSAPTVEERRKLTLWFNQEVVFRGEKRIAQLGGHSGVTAILNDLSEIVLYLWTYE